MRRRCLNCGALVQRRARCTCGVHDHAAPGWTRYPPEYRAHRAHLLATATPDTPCPLCHRPLGPPPWTVDHTTPRAHGGTHTPDNLTVTHPHCNYSKAANTH